MSTLTDDQSSQASSAEEEGAAVTKSAEVHKAKMNGMSEESAGSDTGAGGEPKANGISPEKASSSQKHGDGHHKSSSDKSHKSISSSSSKPGSSSSSSSRHKDGSSSSSKSRDGSSHHSSSSSSKHRDGSSSKHSSSSSSSKSKEGSSSSSSHSRSKDGKSSSSSSSSKSKEGSSSSSSKHNSSSSSSRPKDGSSSSSSSKHRSEGSSSSKDKSSSSSSDKNKRHDKSKESSSSSSSKDKDRSKSSSSSDKHKSSSSSSSGDKHKSSSSSGDKHKSSSSSSSGSKHRSSSSSKGDAETKVKVEPEAANSEKVNCNNSESSHVEVKKEVSLSPVKKEASLSPVKKEAVSPVKTEVASPVRKASPEKKAASPEKKPVVKSEDEDSEEEDVPLSVRMKEARPTKRPKEESDYENEEEDDDDDEDDDVPLSARANQAKKQKIDKKPPPPPKVQVKKETKAIKKEKPVAKKRKGDTPNGQAPSASPTKKKKKEEEEQEVWRWWEEQPADEGTKWKFLEHKGPVFAPLYERVPKNVRFYYDGKPMQLEELTEETATFYGRMLDHDYTTRDVFNTNFLKDWKKVMSKAEREIITDMKKCNFVEYNDYFKKKSEERKALSKEEKQKIKKDNEEMAKEYGFCIIDHHKEKIGNFKIEPPGLFRGRGDHPKQGMLKRRVVPEDVIINCSKDSNIPQPPAGHKWKEVRHDNTVTWLASWNENIQGATKYVMLNAASKLKGQKDWQKYELARKLHKTVDKIRANYQEDWKSKEMRVRQRSVALYFIDKLALRAGNEKDEGETADTVGCCSLRVEHINLHEEKDGKPYVVEFDFLGKDSIRYQNSIPVEKRVFKNLELFVENKAPEDDLFDRLNTSILNKHLQDLMEGLTAKVFRTYNASRTLSEQLELLTNPDDLPAAMILSYNRANRAVAILCNHQRAVPKTFEKSMENLQKKIDNKNADIKVVKKDIKNIKADYKQQKSLQTKTLYEKKKKTLARLEEQLTKLEVQATDKDENKEIALGTSKLNYLDPRISVAWCKKFEVPIEKVYNKTQRDKFRWAIDMATEHFKF